MATVYLSADWTATLYPVLCAALSCHSGTAVNRTRHLNDIKVAQCLGGWLVGFCVGACEAVVLHMYACWMSGSTLCFLVLPGGTWCGLWYMYADISSTTEAARSGRWMSVPRPEF